MDFIVTSLIALGLVWVAVNSLVGVAMFFSPLSARSIGRMVLYITTALTVRMNTEQLTPGYAWLKRI